jgi:hypothetical protein
LALLEHRSTSNPKKKSDQTTKQKLSRNPNAKLIGTPPAPAPGLTSLTVNPSSFLFPLPQPPSLASPLSLASLSNQRPRHAGAANQITRVPDLVAAVVVGPGGRLASPGPMDWASAAYTAAALACAAAATVVALGHIYRHLLHYAEPVYQRFIVRIIFMVPVMPSIQSVPRARLPRVRSVLT